MTDQPIVSVIVNCYNSAKYLRETIDGLIAQSYENWEAIFWDNQSTDKTAEIIASYNEPRFKYFYAEKNTPLGKARNLAMQKASGSYICYLDSDDLWDPLFLSTCTDILNANDDIGLVYTRYFHFSETAKWLSRGIGKSGVVNTRKLVNGYNIGMSAAMFRSSFVNNKSLLFDTRFSLIEDFNFFLKLTCVYKTYFVNLPLMSYRHHDNQSSISDKWVDEYEKMLTIIQADASSPLFPYYKEVKKYQDHYKILSAIDKGHRLMALHVLFGQCRGDIKAFGYLLPILFGKKVINLMTKAIGCFRHI